MAVTIENLSPVILKHCKPCMDCGTPVMHLGGRVLVDPRLVGGRAKESAECGDSPTGYHRVERADDMRAARKEGR